MKIGIIINTNDPETVWNAFRFGVTSLLMEHEIKVFLLGKGVESENIQDEKFKVQEQIGLFVENKGQIFACGTCLKLRQMKGSEVCPVSTMHDMLHIVEESEKVLVFG
ncbi:MAG: DsrE family protein [Candidatus Methanoperedens sp.]|nr:DsrE family protein [Candidatus Methanoperedens sp.]